MKSCDMRMDGRIAKVRSTKQFVCITKQYEHKSEAFMNNTTRIYQMILLAMAEKEHKDQLDGIQNYFRSDYIGRHMIKNGFRITAAYLIALAAWGLYHAETLVVDITQIDVRALGAKILFLYVLVMCIFLVMTYAIQSIRYSRAKMDLQEYRELLKQLELAYRMEDQAQEEITEISRDSQRGRRDRT